MSKNRSAEFKYKDSWYKPMWVDKIFEISVSNKKRLLETKR